MHRGSGSQPALQHRERDVESCVQSQRALALVLLGLIVYTVYSVVYGSAFDAPAAAHA